MQVTRVDSMPDISDVAIDRTPLCPAGHLPLKGGDRQVARPLPRLDGRSLSGSRRPHPISPLEGEMSGRTEGGVAEQGLI